MTLNRISTISKKLQPINLYRLATQFVTLFLFFLFLLSSVSAATQPEKHYLRIAQNKPSDKNDFEITSIGALAFKQEYLGSIDITYFESEIEGNEWALELGGGYVFNADMSLYLGVGVSLGYNKDEDDFIAAYFPEAGIVVDVSNTFGITFSAKRYFNRYDKHEDIVMLGFVFRK